MASLSADLLNDAVVGSLESAMRFLRFDTDLWSRMVADRLAQTGHKVTEEDREELRRRIESYAQTILSYGLMPESPREARDRPPWGRIGAGKKPRR